MGFIVTQFIFSFVKFYLTIIKILNLENMMKALILLAFACFLTACVSTRPHLDCQNPNWHALGVLDGKAGHYSHQISRHQKRCPAAITHNDIALWEQGRQIGLKAYCTKSHAYRLGQMGLTMNAVCPEEGLLELQQSHALGYQTYYQQQRLRQDWLYHSPYSPFYPYWFW